MKLCKHFLIVLSLTSLFSCQEPSPAMVEKSKAAHEASVDSFSRAKYGESADAHVKRMVDESITKAMFDTVGISKAPVKVLKAKIVKEEYSSYRNVYLLYKNVSKKNISAIKFKWYGTNAFNDPADLGSSIAEGFGSGFTDDELKVGRSEGSTWNVLSRDAKKIKLAWPVQVSFVDGTSWKLEE